MAYRNIKVYDIKVWTFLSSTTYDNSNTNTTVGIKKILVDAKNVKIKESILPVKKLSISIKKKKKTVDQLEF